MPPGTRQNGDMQRSQGVVIGVLVVILVAIGAFLFLSSRAGSPSPSVSASTPASAAPAASAEASASASLAADLLDRRWTVLYVGLDQNAYREVNGDPVNTDSLMLVSLSADGSELTLVSLPRDTVDVPLADGGTYPGKINGLYREQGIDALVGAMEALYGVPVDGYAMLDMDDFTALVDAVGGVEVNPEAPLVDPIVDLDLEAGPQHIDAATANGYVRTRVDQDYGRMGRQQEVLLGIVDRITDPTTDVDPRALIEALDSFETDLPIDELPTLLELARRGRDASVERILIEPPLITFEGDRGDGRGYVVEPDVEAIRSEIGERLAD
jgi:LCP family protein required for cell wall assembly